MRMGFVRGGLALAAAFFCFAWNATAQETAEKKRDRSGGYSAIIDNIDMLIDNYGKFLGRKYDLNDEQGAVTKTMLRDRAYDFLNHHEDKIRDLFDRMFEARTGGNMTAEELILWGKEVAPIYEEAKKIISDGNKEWREILNDEQKKIHDEDLKLMETSFKDTDEKITRIQNGEMTVDEFVKPQGGGRRQTRPTPAPPPPAPTDTAVETAVEGEAVSPNATIASKSEKKAALLVAPKKQTEHPVAPVDGNGEAAPPNSPPPDGAEPTNKVVTPAGEAQPPETALEQQPQIIENAPAVAPANDVSNPQRIARPAAGAKPNAKTYESEWERYTREFISKYKLDDVQTQKANTILQDCEAQAERVVQGKKSEIEQLEKRETELKTPAAPAAAGKTADRSKELAELTKKKDELLSPLTRIFEDQLKPKLERLPTRAQRKAAEAAAPKKPIAGKPGAGKLDGKPEGKPEAKPKDGKPAEPEPEKKP